MQQAARVSDFTAFMYLGELIEFGETDAACSRRRTIAGPRTTSPAASADRMEPVSDKIMKNEVIQ